MQRTLALIAFALTLALGSVGSADAGSTKAIWGPTTLPDGASAFPVYEDLGVDVLQLQLHWADIAPSRPASPSDPSDPAYRWPAAIDQALEQAPGSGMRVALMAIGSPRWANGGRDARWAPSNRAFAQFLTAASQRYPAVREWMIWGEANRAAVFQPLPVNRSKGPRRYATLLAAAYRALKRVDRRDVVIGGMTFSFGEVRPREFARWMRLPNGRPPPLDLYGHNPFTRRFPDIRDTGYVGYPGARDIGDVDTFHRELRGLYRGRYRQFRGGGPRLWLSEFTISSDRGNYAFDFYVSRRDQARWLTAAYRIANRSPWIASLGWIGLLDEPPAIERGLTNGLMTYDGRPKPAYRAYKRVP